MPLRRIGLAERIEGGLIGLLVGDALGVPYEFHGPQEIPPADRIEFSPPAGFAPAHRGVPPGTWSDDGAQALCLLASLLEQRSFKPDDFAEKIVLWYQQGHYTPDQRVFDCGLQTRRAILALLQGADPASSGPNGEQDNGNGSLMRVLPLALWHTGDDEDLVKQAHGQSAVTHGHERSQVCCAFYCLWARELLSSPSDAWSDAAAKLKRVYAGSAKLSAELDFVLDPIHGGAVHGSGYVLDSLWSAHQALREPSYESVVRAAIQLGNDTDTTACIAGGLAGIRDGISSIPERWAKGLRGEAVYKPLLAALLKRVANNPRRPTLNQIVVKKQLRKARIFGILRINLLIIYGLRVFRGRRLTVGCPVVVSPLPREWSYLYRRVLRRISFLVVKEKCVPSQKRSCGVPKPGRCSDCGHCFAAAEPRLTEGYCVQVTRHVHRPLKLLLHD